MRKKYLQLTTQKIAYFEMGEGTPLIILPGWGLASDKFLDLQKILSKNFHTFSLDLPGVGESTNPEKPYSVSDYAHTVCEFIRKLNLPEYNILAHSFGGRIAIKIAAEAPVKLKHLILTGAAGIKDKNNLKKKIFKILAKTGNGFFSLPIINKMEKSARKILYKLSKGCDYLKLTDPIMKKTFQLIIEEDLTNLLPKINIPTLLLWGREDTLTPISHAKIMHEKIKNSQIIIYDNIGHRLPYAMPEEFAEEVKKWFSKK